MGFNTYRVCYEKGDVKLFCKKLSSVLLLCGFCSPVTFAQPSNTTVDYFFEKPATLWDLAELRLTQQFSESKFEFVNVNFLGLDYDWDSGIPGVEFTLDLLPGSNPMSLSRAEEMCDAVVLGLTQTISLSHSDTWGNTGFTTQVMNEKVDALKKQMQVRLTIYRTNLSELDPVSGKYEDKNFDSEKHSAIVCSTSGYRESVSRTRR